MTERRIFLSLGAVIFITAFLFIACPSGIPKGNGYVYIRCVLPGNLTEGNTRKTQSRLIGPESGWNIASYRLTFTSENGEVITKSIGKTGAELSLKAGNWSLLAEGLTADGAIIVKETQVLAQAGKRANIQIMMHLAQGKGSLQLALSPNQPLPQDWKYSCRSNTEASQEIPLFRDQLLYRQMFRLHRWIIRSMNWNQEITALQYKLKILLPPQ